MLPCPWCGKKPNWLTKSMCFGTGASGMEAPIRALGCDHLDCPVKPHTEWHDTEMWMRGRGYVKVDFDADAIAKWNARI